MRVDYDVAMEVAAHEALVRQAYKDSKGVLTWCVGMTNATGHRVERYIGKPQMLQHCMNIYAWALTSYAEQVRQTFKDRPLTQAQFAAAVSFHWNTGAIKRASWVKYWLRGDDARAMAAFMNWVTPSEIAKRRGKERDLFFDGKWSNTGSMVEYTRVTARMTPDWSSAKRINVEDELRAAFAGTPTAVLDQAPEPDAVPPAPTLSPDDGEAITTPVIVTTIEEEKPVVDFHPGPRPSPIDQVSKAVGAGKWAAMGAAIWTVVVASGVLPDQFATQEFNVAVTGLITSVAAVIGAYRAPKNAE